MEMNGNWINDFREGSGKIKYNDGSWKKEKK